MLLAEQKKPTGPARLRRGGTLTMTQVDALLAAEPDRFEEHLNKLAHRLDRLGIRLVADPRPGRHESVPASPTRGRDTFSREVLALPRLDREGEYRLARRYALVKRRFQGILDRLDLSHTVADGDLASFSCPDSGHCRGEDCTRWEKAPTAGERQALVERCREFNAVRNEFIEGSLYIVILSLAGFQYSGVSRDDLIQEGNTSLFRAVDRYDWRKGVRFRTYAEYWVNQAFLETIYNQSRTVRIPTWVQKATRKIRKAQALAAAGPDGLADPDEVARRLDLEPAKVAEIIRENRLTVSLDAPVEGMEEGGSWNLESLSTEQGTCEEALERERHTLLPERVGQALATLKPGTGRSWRSGSAWEASGSTP